MAQTKINASQTTITAEDIGAAGAVTTMPTASADNLNKIVQYIGETAGNYVNGYFYKCVQGVIPESFVKIEDVTNPEAEEPTYWVIEVTDFERFRTTYCMQDGQPVASRLYFGCGTGDSDVCYNYTTETEFEPVYVTATDGLDLVECQYSWGSGDYSGDGVLYQYTPASSGYTWERVDVQPGVAYTAGTGIDITNNAISVDDTVLVNNPTGTSSVNIKGSNNNNSNSVAVGSGAAVTNNQGVAVGWGSQAGYDCTAVGAGSLAYDDYSTAIGFGATVPNGVDYSIQIGNGTNNTSGTMSVALSTDGSSWTNYELLSANGTIPEARLADTTNAQQGDVLTLDANGDAVWQTGGSGLPSQTGNAGKFLTTDGTNASWGNSTHQSLYFRSGENVQYGARVFSSGGQVLRIVAVNAQGQDNGYGYSFGVDTFRPEGTNFNLGESVAKWGTTYTTKINNGANITVPSVAGEMAVKQVNTTITLTAAGWSSNTQTVNVTGMTATGVVLVSPDPTDQADYTSAGIICTSQTTNSLTFTATTTPTSDIDVNIVCL